MSESSRRVCGSRPALGSSRKSTAGSCIMRARDRQALHHAAREAVDELVRAVGQLEALEQRVGARLRARRPAGRSRRRGTSGSRAPVRLKSRFGRCGTTPIRRLTSTRRAQTLRSPIQAAPAGRPHARGQDADRRRLAGAVRPEQAEDLAGLMSSVRPSSATTSCFAFAAPAEAASSRSRRAGAPTGGGELKTLRRASVRIPTRT